jgi:carboxyl-terminal processing protease
MSYAEKEGVKKDQKGFDTSRDEIIYDIKALIARNLFDVNAYFQVITRIDDELLKSIEILNDKTMFDKLSIRY